MFVALKNWRERLKHQGGERLIVSAERLLGAEADGSGDLLGQFRATALAPRLSSAEVPLLVELGPQFADAQPLSSAENLSIMASAERGAARS